MTSLIWTVLANSRAITPKSFKGSGWLLNLAEIMPTHLFTKFDDDPLKNI